MSAVARELIDNADAIVHRWYEAWRASARPHRDVAEAALKDHLAVQLRVVGEQLRDLSRAESMQRMWKVTDRLDPEARVRQEIPIEEVVQEYRLAVDVIRDWIAERHIEVSFDEYSFLFGAMFELAAESVRRYARYQAEEVRRGRAEYLAGVMHQLRTPLSVLSTQVEILAGSQEPPDRPALDRFRRSVRRMRMLVDGLLRTERYDPKDVRVRRVPVAPARLIDDIIADCAADTARKPLRIESSVSGELRMEVDVDLFIDAIGNIVENAVKYTAAGVVSVSAEEDGDVVVFKVRDTGPGIAPDVQGTLFRDLQPGSGGGAGIGLRIAYHACAAQGGEMGVKSVVGQGSEFWLRLPRSRPRT